MASASVISYYLANHPAITSFRWSHSDSWGSTWPFLFSSLLLYLLLSLLLLLALSLLRRRGPVPLGPIPALHSLAMCLLSALIFLGLLVSSSHEIEQTRWLWRRTRTSTPFQWLLCFPLGTRPSGRIFFWSYLFYLTRHLHLLRAFILILQRRSHAVTMLFTHSALVCMSYLWLEFSQSFQVVAILSATLAQAVVFGYRFWVGVGLPAPSKLFPAVVTACQIGLLGCNLVCHFGFLMFHFWGAGCEGIGAWIFNSLLNGVLLLLFLDWYVRKGIRLRHHTTSSSSSSSSDEVKLME